MCDFVPRDRIMQRAYFTLKRTNLDKTSKIVAFQLDAENNPYLEIYVERIIISQETIRENYKYLKLTYSRQSQL